LTRNGWESPGAWQSRTAVLLGIGAMVVAVGGIVLARRVEHRALHAALGVLEGAAALTAAALVIIRWFQHDAFRSPLGFGTAFAGAALVLFGAARALAGYAGASAY
jgi:drug/metabolite transporter (DMT)-like permease